MRIKKAFTLIELLVVISIIAVLMSVMMPALGKIRKSAQRTICGTRLKGAATYHFLYAADNAGRIPPMSDEDENPLNPTAGSSGYKYWWKYMVEYMSSDKLDEGDESPLVCPTAYKNAIRKSRNHEFVSPSTYGRNIYLYEGSGWENIWFKPMNLSNCNSPGEKIFFTDGFVYASPLGVSCAWPFTSPEYLEASIDIHNDDGVHAGDTINIAWVDGHISSEKRKQFIDSKCSSWFPKGVNSDQVGDLNPPRF